MAERGFKIVLMGVDNSGKTTLANNLIETLNKKLSYSDLFNYKAPLGPAPLCNQLSYMDEILSSKDNLIIDRLPMIEEEVAGRVFRNKSNFDGVNKTVIFEYYQNVDLIIWCNPVLDVITNWGDRPQMEGVKENASKLYSGYSHLFSSLIRELGDSNIVAFATYNWSMDVAGKRCHDLVAFILEMLKERRGETE